MKTRKCIVCGEEFEPKRKNQSLCSEKCKIDYARRKARERRPFQRKETLNLLPYKLRAIRPDYCKENQCHVIKETVAYCREGKKPLEEIMPMKWETDEKCLCCQDESFKHVIKLLRRM